MHLLFYNFFVFITPKLTYCKFPILIYFQYLATQIFIFSNW